MQMCKEYMEALEEEHRKIQVFQRELPLCLELVTQAIEECKSQLSGAVNTFYFQQPEEHDQDNDCNDQTSSHVPILEEFIPIKRTSSSDVDRDEEKSHKYNSSTEKSDWLKSVKLWNQSPDPSQKEELPKNESVIGVVKQDGGVLRIFDKLHKEIGTNKEKSSKIYVKTTIATRTVKENRQRESKRKQRRCWSPELHRRFLNSLQQLGGAHVATPKQVRELMKVDGLSNDEVKSHLQKYRLHTGRPSSTTHNNGNPQASQFVIVGGIWVQPSEYAAKMGETSISEEDTGGVITTDTDIYASVASLPPSRPHRSKHSYSEENGSHSTSSSTHT